MQAISSSPQELRWTSAEPPQLGPGQVLIEVAATAVNRADLAQRAGRYPAPAGASPILGLECSGTVVQRADDVRSPALGDQVCALLSGGGYAQYAAVPAGHVLPVPEGLSLDEAAALPEVFATAWLNLRLEGVLQSGERVLLHAGASGVGTAAIQLCRLWGNPVVVTVGSSSKADFCRGLGAELALQRQQDWWEAVADGVDLILDPVGAAYLEPNLKVLRPGGRLVHIGLMGGSAGQIDLATVMIKRLRLIGSVLRSRSLLEKNQIIAGLLREVWPHLASGQLRPIIDRVLPIQQAEQAHQWIQSNQSIGKVVLRVRT